jgi:hypothetical protein
MYACVHVCSDFTCTTQIHISCCINLYAHIHTCMHAYHQCLKQFICIHIHTHMHACMHTYHQFLAAAFICIHIHTRMCAYIPVSGSCIYLYTHNINTYMHAYHQFLERRKILHLSMLQNFDQDLTRKLMELMKSEAVREKLSRDTHCKRYKEHEDLFNSIITEVCMQ